MVSATCEQRGHNKLQNLPDKVANWPEKVQKQPDRVGAAAILSPNWQFVPLSDSSTTRNATVYGAEKWFRGCKNSSGGAKIVPGVKKWFRECKNGSGGAKMVPGVEKWLRGWKMVP